MKYLIKSYNQDINYFKCEDEKGLTHNLDLFTADSFDGFGKIKNLDYKSLIGKSITVLCTTPYISFAHGVKLKKI